MSIHDRFTNGARRAVIAAGLDAMDRGRDRLDTDLLLLGLVQATPTLHPHVDADAVRQEIDRTTGAPDRDDRALLATLGIDLDEVTRRMYGSAGVRRDDPRLWTLRRATWRPLRMTLRGPARSVRLTGHSRKVIEVAAWAAGRGRPITGEHLLWGLLADGTNESVRVLRRLGVDLRPVYRNMRGGRGSSG
jgi:hypothetical protein